MAVPDETELFDSEEKKLPPRDPETGKFVKSDPDAELKPPVDPPPAPLTRKHPSWLVERARQWGLDDDTINDTPTLALHRHIHDLDSNLNQQQPKTPAKPDDDDGWLGQVDWGKDEEGKKRSYGDYDSGIINGLKALAKQNRELVAYIRQQEQREAQRQATESSEKIDDAFEALGEKYEKLFGKGGYADVKDKPEFKRRLAVIQESGINISQPPRNLKKKLQEAADALYGPAIEKPAEPEEPYAPKGRISQEQWKNGGVARPTQRSGAPEPAGEEKARRNMERKFRENAAGDSEVLDGLPG